MCCALGALVSFAMQGGEGGCQVQHPQESGAIGTRALPRLHVSDLRRVEGSCLEVESLRDVARSFYALWARMIACR